MQSQASPRLRLAGLLHSSVPPSSSPPALLSSTVHFHRSYPPPSSFAAGDRAGSTGWGGAGRVDGSGGVRK
ncbi:hypothetical protein BT69DRAFT_661809 [Atractiella rhizophila]|nr:hypothetical protein BT69DRAFT_661809 [Atractiella rhizophila]